MACAPGWDPRSLSGVALGDHAAANHGADGRALLCALPRSVPHGGSARRRGSLRRAQALGRARLLRARTQTALAELPGIGPYTAAAIAAIAFDARATPIDGNIERVITRLFAYEHELPAGKPALGTW